MIRAYFVPMALVAGSNVPSGMDGLTWGGHAVPSSGKAFVLTDVTPSQHAAVVAVAGVVYLPIEDARTFGDISVANRASLKTLAEAQGVPTQSYTLATLISDAFKWMKRRMLLAEQLGVDDLTEVLDTLVSAVPGAKRTAIANKLTALGYDTSVIIGSDTIREAVRKLITQDVAANRTGDE